MKPPARKRNKPDRNLNTEPPQSEPAGTCQWQRFEQNNLLKALKTIYRFNGGNGDIDYNYLKKHVPTRSIPEIQSVVEYLKSSVLSLASTKLKKRRWEEKFLKPIELWTSMASTLAGTHEEPISAAFSQMLIVSSTEPCTLRNSDPPQDPRSLTNRPVGRTVPLRPMPQGPVKVTHPGTNAARPVVVLKTPGPAMCPAPSQVVRGMNGKVPPPQRQLSTTAGTSPSSISTSQSGSSPASTSTSQSESLPAGASTSQSGSSPASTSTSQSGILPASTSTSQSGTSPASTSTSQFAVTGHNTPGSGCAVVVNTQSVGSSQIQTPQQPSEQSPTPISSGSTSTSDSPGPHASLYSPASGQTPVPSRAPFSGTSSVPPKAPLSSPAATFHANFGRTNKHFTKDSPRAFGVKSVVDFEKIYCYLSGIHQPNDDLCQLTPMESAIMLDLLMSLPEELPLLDCNKLQKHLLQVYDCLSFTADYEMAEEIFKELKDGLYPREDKRTDQQQSPAAQSPAAQSPAGGEVAASGGKKLQPDGAENESSGSGIASGQSGPSEEAGGTDLFPALNPFMVPLKLLMRK